MQNNSVGLEEIINDIYDTVDNYPDFFSEIIDSEYTIEEVLKVINKNQKSIPEHLSTEFSYISDDIKEAKKDINWDLSITTLEINIETINKIVKKFDKTKRDFSIYNKSNSPHID